MLICRWRHAHESAPTTTSAALAGHEHTAAAAVRPRWTKCHCQWRGTKEASVGSRRCYRQNAKSVSSLCFLWFYRPSVQGRRSIIRRCVRVRLVSVFVCVRVCASCSHRCVLPPAEGGRQQQEQQQGGRGGAAVVGGGSARARGAQVGDGGPLRVELDDVELIAFVVLLLLHGVRHFLLFLALHHLRGRRQRG